MFNRTPPELRERPRDRAAKNHRDLVIVRDGGVCAQCRKQFLPNRLEVDHIIPRRDRRVARQDDGVLRLTDGRAWDDPTNKQTLCVDCHRAKTAAERRAARRRGAFSARVDLDGQPITRVDINRFRGAVTAHAMDAIDKPLANHCPRFGVSNGHRYMRFRLSQLAERAMEAGDDVWGVAPPVVAPSRLRDRRTRVLFGLRYLWPRMNGVQLSEAMGAFPTTVSRVLREPGTIHTPVGRWTPWPVRGRGYAPRQRNALRGERRRRVVAALHYLWPEMPQELIASTAGVSQASVSLDLRRSPLQKSEPLDSTSGRHPVGSTPTQLGEAQ